MVGSTIMHRLAAPVHMAGAAIAAMVATDLAALLSHLSAAFGALGRPWRALMALGLGLAQALPGGVAILLDHGGLGGGGEAQAGTGQKARDQNGGGERFQGHRAGAFLSQSPARKPARVVPVNGANLTE